jgi:hypothetical protein
MARWKQDPSSTSVLELSLRLIKDCELLHSSHNIENSLQDKIFGTRFTWRIQLIQTYIHNMKPSVLVAWALVMAVLLLLCGKSVDCKSEHRILKRSTANTSTKNSASTRCTYRFRCQKKKKVRAMSFVFIKSFGRFTISTVLRLMTHVRIF